MSMDHTASNQNPLQAFLDTIGVIHLVLGLVYGFLALAAYWGPFFDEPFIFRLPTYVLFLWIVVYPFLSFHLAGCGLSFTSRRSESIFKLAYTFASPFVLMILYSLLSFGLVLLFDQVGLTSWSAFLTRSW